MNNTWDESEHPRDEDGKFTFKNGGTNSSSGIVLKGEVEKTDRYDDHGEGGGWHDVLGGIGDILGNVFGIITNPAVVQGVLGILAAKYTMSELKNFKEMLSVISKAKSETANTANASGYAQTTEDLIRRDYENERKTKERADVLYPSIKNEQEQNSYNTYNNDKKYNSDDYWQNVLYYNTDKSLYMPISEHYEYNENYKPIHDTYRKILIDANTYAGKENIDGFKPYYSDANHKTGFYGRAYINNQDKTVVIAYKGSDQLSFKKDWWDNNLQMWINKEIPKQYKDAEQFYFDVKEKLIKQGKNYKIDFAGYSLGGTLAELMGTKYGNETVTFNAFGIGQMKDAEINYTDNIINYGHRYDKVYNMNNTNHVGEKIYTDKIGDENLIRNIKKYHELENMGDLQNRYKKELNKIP